MPPSPTPSSLASLPIDVLPLSTEPTFISNLRTIAKKTDWTGSLKSLRYMMIGTKHQIEGKRLELAASVSNHDCLVDRYNSLRSTIFKRLSDGETWDVDMDAVMESEEKLSILAHV